LPVMFQITLEDISGESEVERDLDVAIVGGGPAGLTAALYAGRSMLKTVVFEKLTVGGQIAVTDDVDNYPGMSLPKGWKNTPRSSGRR